MQAFSFPLFERWQGYERPDDVIRTITAEEAPSVVGPKDIGQYDVFVTANVVREARAHFGCPEMVGVLMEERPEQVTDHLSMRHYQVPFH